MKKGQASPSLLLCDVGNSNLKLAFADHERLLAVHSLPSRSGETQDSLGLAIAALMAHDGVDAGALEACVAASVSPALDPILKGAVERYAGCPVFFTPRDLPLPIENKYPRPHETGADRLVCAWAASRLFPDEQSIVVVDFGTAATFDCVSGGAFLGGLIFPGPGIAAMALAQNTAKLPPVNFDFSDQEPRICVDTATSIQHGIIFGYKHLVAGLCGSLAASLPGRAKIVGTGAFASALARISGVFDLVAPALALDGLRDLYYTEKPGGLPAGRA